MRRWITSMLAALVVAMPLLALDKSADEKGNDRATQFKALQKDFQKSAEDATKQLRKATTQEEFQKIVSELSKEYTPRIVKLAKSDPKDKVSGDVLFWAITNVPLDGGKVYDLLAENWVTDARIKRVCERMAQSPDEDAQKLLRKVSEENKDKAIQGLAYFALAKMSETRSQNKGDVKASEEAEKLFERLNKDFAEVKTARGTIGDQAKSSLMDIRARGVGKKMPNLESENLQGKKAQLKDYKGKIVVVDIWATWCGPGHDSA
jgi:hypothetical protein